MLRAPKGYPRDCKTRFTPKVQLVGIQSEAKIKMAAIETENKVVTNANSMPDSFY